MSRSEDETTEIPLLLNRQIDAICDEYESHLAAGGRIDFAERLGQVDTSVRQRLLAELAAITADHVRATGEDDPTGKLLAFGSHFDSAVKIALSNNDGEPTLERSDFTVSFDSSSRTYSPEGKTQPGFATSDDAGRFSSIRHHASGGIGDVSVARDTQLCRDVAFKQLQNKFADDPEKRTRFVLEGEVTGALEHPGIVPVYALGTDSAGRPFYAMRFVRGESMRAASKKLSESSAPVRASRDNPDFRRLLESLIRVCQAVDYAHKRGVLHRDIKPDNVMLGKHGEVYVVDWGMARVMNDDTDSREITEGKIDSAELSGSSDEHTGMAMGTLAYMSPEQAAGQVSQLTAATDIYSLGATLYQLLCGRSPFDTKATNIRAVLANVQEARFNPPRTRAPKTPKELDAICVKAMARYPSDRYAAAADLGSDLQRWLDDAPTTVCPPSLLDTALRWVRRNRGWAVTAALLLTTVAVVSTVSAVVIRRIASQNRTLYVSERSARDEADRRFLESRDTVDRWLTTFTDALRYQPGTQNARGEMLRRAAEQYQDFVAERPEDPSVQLEHGRTLVRLAVLYRELKNPRDALIASKQASEALRGISDDWMSEAVIEQARAQGIAAAAHGDLGDFRSATRAFEGAFATLDDHDWAEAMVIEHDALRVSLLINRGSILALSSDATASESDFLEAVELATALVQKEPESIDRRISLVTASQGLGRALRSRGDLAGSIDRLEAARDLLAAASQLRIEELGLADRYARANIDLAISYGRRGDTVREATAYRQAVSTYRSLAKKQPDYPDFAFQLALAENDLGALLTRSGSLDEADQVLTSACETLNTLSQQFASQPELLEAAGAAQDNLASVYQIRGDYAAASKATERSREYLRPLVKTYPDQSQYAGRLAVVQTHAACAAVSLGKSEEASQYFRSAWTTIAEIREPSSSPFLTSTAIDIATIYLEHGPECDLEEDAVIVKQSLQDLRRSLINDQGLELDAALKHAVAWSFATDEDVTKSDCEVAFSYAEYACEAAPLNRRFIATRDFLAMRLGRLPSAPKQSAEPQDPESIDGAIALLSQSLSAAASGNRNRGRTILQAVKDWQAEFAPGDRELRIAIELTTNLTGPRPQDTPGSAEKPPIKGSSEQ